ncbi:MAG: bifunctional DNA-formamidopyrimidine glycosylase/DNA-(apurinic or apyrimidinic site) lyase [Patescibacteria group bacterium]|jgi:formamidopyrimidine-DNA glycosylase
MPELPEVQTIVNDLNQYIPNKKVVNIEIKKKKLIKSDYAGFRKLIIGSSIKKIERRGKLLIFFLNKPDAFLLIHLKMTGQLIYENKKKIIAGGHSLPKVFRKDLPGKYTHVIFTFADKSQLFFNDMRQFGYLKIVNSAKKEEIISAFGIEPLSSEFNLKKFQEIIKTKKTSVKAILMDQKFIAGIGNIYADEICFAAKIKPDRLTSSLKNQEIIFLHQSIKKVLRAAIKHRGTTFSDYLDASGKKGNYVRFLKVYQREKMSCPRCKKSVIIKSNNKIAGRGTRYCPKCQK